MDASPDPTCISQTLGESTYIRSVEENHHRNATPNAGDFYQWFYYSHDDLSGILTIRAQPDRVSFGQSYHFINRRPPRLQETRALMARVERDLETACVPGLTATIREHCKNVECPPLESN